MTSLDIVNTSIQCPNCGAPIDRASLDRRLAVVECSNCSTMVDLVKAANSTVPGARDWVNKTFEDQAEILPEKRALAYKPKYFKEFRRSGEIEFHIPFPPLVRIGAVAAIVGLLIFAFMGILENNPIVVVFILFIAIVILYMGVLAKFHIKATRESVTLFHSPSLFRKPVVISSSHIKQFFVSKSVERRDNVLAQLIAHATKRVEEIPIPGSWSLRAVLEDDNAYDIISNFPTLEEVLYLEQELELQLGIRDAPVGSEEVNQTIESSHAKP